MEVFSRSWEITKLSYAVMKKDKELLMFPVLALIFSVIFILVILFPTVIIILISGDKLVFGLIQYLAIFIIYLGLAFIATFFNVCTVYTIKKRFEGGNSKSSEAIKFAFSKIYLIFLWSLLAATVGLILKLIEGAAQRIKGVGGLIVNLIQGFLGMAWSIITLFVIPSIVYKNMTPINAIKNSVGVLKRTWGESLIRVFGLGFAEFLFIIAGIIVLIPLFFISAVMGIFGILFILLLAIIYFVGVALIFSVMNSVFNTALYVYGETGKVPSEFNERVIKNAFKTKNSITKMF